MRLTNINKTKMSLQLKNVANLLIKTLGVGIPATNEDVDKYYAHTPTEAFWTGEHASSNEFFTWLKSFGINAVAGKIPKFIDGGDGRAYFVGTHVIKFTRDRAGANVANMCIGVPDAPTPVIAVWRVPGQQPLWVILQWKVHPEKVPTYIKMAADYLTAWIDENPGIESFPTNKTKQQREAKRLLTALNGPMSLIPSIVLVMNVHNKLYFTTGFSHTDGGPTNISMRTGDGSEDDLVYHDLGPNMTKDYSARKVLDQVHNNRKKLSLQDVEEV